MDRDAGLSTDHQLQGLEGLSARPLPGGTVTLLFTDIEGSTRLLQQLGERYADLLATCRQIMRGAFEHWHGYEVDTQGDAFFVAFTRAREAVAAAVDVQRKLSVRSWPEGLHVRVRIGLHTGEPRLAGEGYVGLDVHRAARIMGASHGGQVLLSQTTRDLVDQDLPADISLLDLGEHQLKDLDSLAHLYQLVIPDLPADFPPPTTIDTRSHLHHFPGAATTFIGRRQEMEAMNALLQRADVRLLTLTGPAGVGKTRLAVQAVQTQGANFPAGIFFVPLEQICAVEEVLPALAQALEIPEPQAGTLLDGLKRALRDQRLLLVLDNFEQVISASLLVAELLKACRRLKVIVTSRVVLRLQAEQVFVVPPLELPASGSTLEPEQGQDYSALALFVQRAQIVQPDFRLTSANIGAVSAICARLDGLPLALELAAARSRSFSPQTLLTRLEQGLAILAGGAHDRPTRQRSLQAAIAWSYDLLTAQEQQVFRWLAIFVRGGSLEAVEQVCQAAEGLSGSVLEILDALVDKSLLRQQTLEDGSGRFWLLQTLREFGLERLAQGGEMEQARDAHALYYLAWAERLAPRVLSNEQTRWLDTLEREYDNLRLALEWLLGRAESEPDYVEQALRLCIALLAFWEIRGLVSEGGAFVERALALKAETKVSIRAEALNGAGILALIQDDGTKAEARLREGQALFESIGDRAGLARILRMQGSLARTRNNYKLARRLLEEAQQLFQQVEDHQRVILTRETLAQVAITQGSYGRARLLLEENLAYYTARDEQSYTAFPLYQLARVHLLSADDLAQARKRAETSLALFKKTRNQRLTAYALHLLAQIQLIDGNYEEIRNWLDESLDSFHSLLDRYGICLSLLELGRLLTRQGAYVEALAVFEECGQRLHALGDKELSATFLEAFGELLIKREAIARAVRIWSIAATVRADIGAPMHRVYRPAYLQAVSGARSSLGEERFKAAWSEGSQVPLAQALLIALPAPK